MFTTETLAAWGVTPVACTRFCERPDLPAVGGTKDPDVGAIVVTGDRGLAEAVLLHIRSFPT